MTFGLINSQERYRVETPVFEGPMDLLLSLIERAELDITRLALAQVTDQFLKHVRQMKDLAAEEVSSFLVIAAKLLQIKSEVLLPRPPEREVGEEDPGEALARQLIAYKRYKEIANLLAERKNEGLQTYLRLAPPPKVEAKIDLTGLTLEHLVAAAKHVYQEAAVRAPLGTVVSRPKVTIREKIRAISRAIRTAGKVRFQDILGAVRTRLDVVVSFLALLELVKRQHVDANQSAMFSDIEITPTDSWSDDQDFELEFGE